MQVKKNKKSATQSKVWAEQIFLWGHLAIQLDKEKSTTMLSDIVTTVQGSIDVY